MANIPIPAEVNYIHSYAYIRAIREASEDDIVIATKNGHNIRTSSFILKARSPVFRAMLSLPMRENNTGVIDMTTYNSESVLYFISYIDEAILPPRNLHVLVLDELYSLAKQHNFEDLRRYVLSLLIIACKDLSEAISIVRGTEDDDIKRMALTSIHNLIIKPNGSKVELSSIDDEIKIALFDYILTKQRLVR